MEEKATVNDLEEQFPAAEKCRCNPDHNKFSSLSTGNPGSVIVPQYDSSKITVFVLGKNTILKFVGNTKFCNFTCEITN